MIVCSCNVLTARQVLDTLATEDVARPRSVGQVYRCLGCKPNCGRCMTQIRALLSEARGENCNVGCATCPGAETPALAPAPARQQTPDRVQVRSPYRRAPMAVPRQPQPLPAHPFAARLLAAAE